MALNEYSLPAQFKAEPMDWDAAFKVGAIQQKRVEDLDDLMAKVSATKVPVIPDSIDEQKQQQFENGVHSNLMKISDDLSHGRMDYRDAHKKVLENAYSFNSPEVTKRQTSYQNYLETQKGIQKLKETPGYYNPNLHDQMLDAKNYDTGQVGVWNKFPVAAMDLDKHSIEAWNGLNKETSYRDNRQGSPTKGMMMVGVDPQNMPNYANVLAKANLNTPAGQQINQLYNSDKSKDPEQVLTDFYLHTGLEHQLGKIDDSWYRLQEERAKNKPQTIIPDITSHSGVIENNPVDTKKEDNLLNDNDNFDKTGNLIPPNGKTLNPAWADILKKHNNISDTPSFMQDIRGVQKFLLASDPNNPQFKENQGLLQHIKDNQPQITVDEKGNSLSDKQVLDKWTKAKKSLANEAIQAFTPSTTANNDFKERFFPKDGGMGDIKNKSLDLVTKNGIVTGGTTDIARELGYGRNTELPDDAMKSAKITGIQTIGIHGASYIANIKDSDGKYQTLLIPMDDEVQHYFRTSQKLYEMINSGEEGAYQDPYTGITNYVKPVIDPKTGKFTSLIKRFKDGQPIDKRDPTFEQISQAEKNNYMLKSGYVGSELYNEDKKKP